jgi:hypothetical protein
MFPLFEQLYKETQDKDLSTSQKKTFLSKMEKIDQEGMNLMHALISAYQEDSEESRTLIPYDGKKIGSDISFNLETLPLHLRQILHKFVLMHIKRIVDEQKLAEKINLTTKPQKIQKKK